MAKYKVSADIGGTFTDIVVEDDAGAVRIGKVPTSLSVNPRRSTFSSMARRLD